MLPYDGNVQYFEKILNQEKANIYFENLIENLNWKHNEAIIFRKKIILKRKVAWYGDIAYEYAYSNVVKHALPWTKVFYELKELIEKISNEKFNSCLANLYHNGAEGMA